MQITWVLLAPSLVNRKYRTKILLKFLVFAFVLPCYSNSRWALCPAGHFLQGLYRTSDDWLHNIEEGKCCKPVGLPNAYGKCVDKDIGISFDNKGVSSCDDGYYMAGFYRGVCDRLYCIEKIKCCKMYESK